MRKPVIYILASHTGRALYIGVTTNLPRRLERFPGQWPETRARKVLITQGIFRPADSSRTEYALAEHRNGEVVHTAKYRIDRLIYIESHETAPDAIAREKQLKNWSRRKKIELINRANPDWRDLSGEIHDLG